MLTLRLGWAFLVRDLRIEASHRAGLAARIAAGAGGVVVFFFIARALRGAAATALDDYGRSYFGFTVVGLALLSYLSNAVGAMAAGIRESQAAGTLELVVVSPARTPLILLCSSFAGFPLAGLSFAAYLGTGAVLGLDLGHANIGLAALTMALATLSFAALGVLVAAVVFVTSRG